MGLLRRVDWNILLGKDDCGGHTLLSFPNQTGFLKKQKEEFEADFSFSSSKASKGKLVTNHLLGSKRAPCGWCLLLHFMGSHLLITTSELPSHACNLPVE